MKKEWPTEFYQVFHEVNLFFIILIHDYNNPIILIKIFPSHFIFNPTSEQVSQLWTKDLLVGIWNRHLLPSIIAISKLLGWMKKKQKNLQGLPLGGVITWLLLSVPSVIETEMLDNSVWNYTAPAICCHYWQKTIRGCVFNFHRLEFQWQWVCIGKIC
jgi:hypothetical protein